MKKTYITPSTESIGIDLQQAALLTLSIIDGEGTEVGVRKRQEWTDYDDEEDEEELRRRNFWGL